MGGYSVPIGRENILMKWNAADRPDRTEEISALRLS
jgi:hypothetical protein